MEQTYPGEDDFVNHFNTMLSAFKDKRYIKVDGKLLFIVYNPLDSPLLKRFIEIWQELAKKNGLKGFYFVGKTDKGRFRKEILELGYDATYNDAILNVHHHQNIIYKVFLELRARVLHYPKIFKYKDAIKYMLCDEERADNAIPVIAPNWDHTPRSGANGILLEDCNPKYFKNLVRNAINLVKDKPADKQIVIIKAWNEWGEGNYMEPDLKYRRGMLEALKDAISENRI